MLIHYEATHMSFFGDSNAGETSRRIRIGKIPAVSSTYSTYSAVGRFSRPEQLAGIRRGG